MGWDQPPSLRVDVDRLFKIVITFDCDCSDKPVRGTGEPIRRGTPD